VFAKDKMEAAEVAALRERFQNMKIVARAKVTQDRVYSAAYHPDPTTDLIFFGGEWYTQGSRPLVRDWLADGGSM
jgi:WD repeat-containing protein 76